MSADAAGPEKPERWWQAWPDVLAFASGLAVAGISGWKTTDLVWSLWLASLVVGYATIVWTIFGPAVFIGTKAWQVRAVFRPQPKGPMLLAAVIYFVGALFLLAFFTLHFGMFHYVHSVFLQMFFPTGPTTAGMFRPTPEFYFAVLKNYWVFLPVAFLAERQAFRLAPPEPEGPPDTSVKAADIAARKARNAKLSGMTGMMAPYKNVLRLHLLIFFFAGAHFAKLENFFVYAVVYAAYFFPWRLLRKEATAVRQS